MPIYVLNGFKGDIITRVLQSSDLLIKSPRHSVPELIVLKIVNSCDGVFRAEFGGWVIPAKKSDKAYLLLEQKCIKIS